MLQAQIAVAIKAGRDASALVARSRRGDRPEWSPWWWIRCGVPEMDFEWGAFLALNGTRGKGFGEWQPISYVEIEALQRVHGVALDPWQVSVVRALDDLWMRTERRARSRRTPASS